MTVKSGSHSMTQVKYRFTFLSNDQKLPINLEMGLSIIIHQMNYPRDSNTLKYPITVNGLKGLQKLPQNWPQIASEMTFKLASNDL